MYMTSLIEYSNFLSNRGFMLFSVGNSKSMKLGDEESQGMASHSSYEDSHVEGHNSKHHQVKETDSNEIKGSFSQPSHDGVITTLDEGLVRHNLRSHSKEEHKQDG